MGDDTNSALTQQSESLKDHSSEKTISAVAVISDAFEQAKQTVISKSLEVAVSQMDQQLRDLNERTELLEKSLGRQLAHKEDTFSADRKNQQLQMIESRMEQLLKEMPQLVQAVGRKAEASELQECRYEVKSLGEELDEVKAGTSTAKDASMLDVVDVRLANLEKAAAQDNAAIKDLERAAAQDNVAIKNIAAAETKTTSAETTALSESLEGTMRIHDVQLRRLQDRTEFMKEQLKELAAQMETKAGLDNITLLSQGLAACNRTLVDFREDQLPNQLAHKVDRVLADKQFQKLDYVEEQTGQLMSAMSQLVGVVSQKAEASAVADMESDFRMDLEELTTMVDGHLGMNSNGMESLKEVKVRLDNFEIRRSAEKELTAQLAEQCKETTARCTRLEDVVQKLQLQDQLDMSDFDGTDQESSLAHRTQTDLSALAPQRPGSSRLSSLRKYSLSGASSTLQHLPNPVPPRSPKRSMTFPSKKGADLPSVPCPELGAVTPRSTILQRPPSQLDGHALSSGA
jgi:hypothetical protein